MGALRGASILAGFFALTIPLMPVQAVLLRVAPTMARRFPHWYHKRVCRLLGIRLSIEGSVPPDAPVLIVSNHTSWLDIPVLSAVAPVSFVAKKQVGTWPFVSMLAKLQRSVFIDRDRRQASGAAASEIRSRLDSGEAIVLFAEGTSSDGNGVLPFKSALFGALWPGVDNGVDDMPSAEVLVQSVAIVYTHVHGVAIGRANRPRIGWYGDMEMRSHAWDVLKSGPIDVCIRVGEPMPMQSFGNRKDLALETEGQVRNAVLGILRARPAGEPLQAVMPDARQRRPRAPERGNPRDKWT